MCGCGGGSGVWSSSTSGSGYWGSAATRPSESFVVKRPKWTLNNGRRVMDGYEVFEVDTYQEGDSLLRAIDPVTGKPYGGGIERKRVA